MALELWTSADLAELRQDLRLDPVPDYFWRRFFPRDFYSEDRDILIADLPNPYRKLAPFVMPSSQGKPIFERRGEKVRALTPPYIKPKDAVRAVDARNVLPSQIWREGRGLPSLQERFDQRVAEVMAFHERAINMQKAWMAARAILDGKVTIVYAADQGGPHPEVIVDFGRASNHTVVLSGTFWSDPTYDIIGDLSTWSNRMYEAPFGGRPDEVIVGASVVQCLQKNDGIRALLTTQSRGGEDTRIKLGMINIDNGPSAPAELSYVMTLGGIGQSLTIYTYKDVVEAPNGSMIDILDPRDVFMIAPGVDGVMAHGAIYDVQAFEQGSISVDIFPKMWTENDPGDAYIMNQCSPLPIPFNPNRTLKARVLA
jgi:hypothetical protein